MAVCNVCDKDMLKVDSCVYMTVPVEQNGKVVALGPIPHDGEGRCHDCNATPGSYHHPGCDTERCPSCQGQLISCGCLRA